MEDVRKAEHLLFRKREREAVDVQYSYIAVVYWWLVYIVLKHKRSIFRSRGLVTQPSLCAAS